MTNLVRISKADEKNLPFKGSTFYAWKHRKKHPELFVKVGKSLFVDLDALNRLIEQGRLKK